MTISTLVLGASDAAGPFEQVGIEATGFGVESRVHINQSEIIHSARLNRLGARGRRTDAHSP